MVFILILLNYCRGLLAFYLQHTCNFSGGKVAAIGIDACAKETCQVGFCYNDIQPQRTYSIISDNNGIVPANPSSKTFISIDMKVVAICRVEPKRPKTCKDKPCKYGGKCTDHVNGGYTCSCSKKYAGPECQVTTKSFKTKQSYLWLKPFNYFFEGTLSFEFVTKESDGVILYQGPVSESKLKVLCFSRKFCSCAYVCVCSVTFSSVLFCVMLLFSSFLLCVLLLLSSFLLCVLLLFSSFMLCVLLLLSSFLLCVLLLLSHSFLLCFFASLSSFLLCVLLLLSPHF